MPKTTDVINAGRVLNTCVVEVEVDGEFQRIAGFRDVNVNEDRQSTILSATDDGLFAGQTLRDDLSLTGTFEAPRSAYWAKVMFDNDVISSSFGASVNVTDELVVCDYKKGVGGIYEGLLKNSDKDGTTKCTVTAVDLVDDDGAVITANLVLDTDYVLGINNGFTTITAVAGGVIASLSDPSGARLKVDYSYEPLVSMTFGNGEAKTPSTKRFRVTEVPAYNASTDEQPQYVEYIIEDAIVTTGSQIQFRDKNGENEPFRMPITIQNSQGTQYKKTYYAR